MNLLMRTFRNKGNSPSRCIDFRAMIVIAVSSGLAFFMSVVQVEAVNAANDEGILAKLYDLDPVQTFFA